jgi:hypothetical protein
VKIFVISNTDFGHKNHKSFIEYFIKDFFPYIQQNAEKGDVLIHTGGLFQNKSFNLTTIGADVYELFNLITDYVDVKFIVTEKDRTKSNNSNTLLMFNNHPKIEIIQEHTKYDNYEIIPYCKNFKEIEKTKKLVFYDNSVIINGKRNKFSYPYQLSKLDESKKKGFYVYDTETDKFTFKENKYTKKFISIEVNNEEDLNSLKEELFDDNIHLKLNRDFYESNQNKVDVILSRFNINDTSLFQEEKEYENVEISDNLEKNIIEEISKLEESESIMEEFNKIFEIYKKRLS